MSSWHATCHDGKWPNDHRISLLPDIGFLARINVHDSTGPAYNGPQVGFSPKTTTISRSITCETLGHVMDEWMDGCPQII